MEQHKSARILAISFAKWRICPAADHAFQTGDVILDVGGKPVANVSQVREALRDARRAANTTR